MKRILAIITLLALIASTSFGAVGIMPPAKVTVLDNAGKLCVGCKVCFFVTGSTTPMTTYTDYTGLIANTNPIVANSRGEISAWYDGTAKVKVMAAAQTSCTTGTALYTQDGVPSVAYTALTLSEWMSTGSTAWTYVAATQFSVAGDKTSVFQVGRRLKATSNGTLYGRITASAFTTVTTVTVAWDSGSLDAGGITDMNISVPSVTSKSLSFDMISSGTVTATVSGALTIPATINSSGSNTFSGSINSSSTNTWTGSNVFSNATGTITASMVSATTNTAGTNVNVKIKVLDIGDWNMDTGIGRTVAHGLTYTKIRCVSASIRRDDDTATYDISFYNLAGASNNIGIYWTSDNVVLERLTGGFFDSTDFDATSFNRGWITITYIE